MLVRTIDALLSRNQFDVQQINGEKLSTRSIFCCAFFSCLLSQKCVIDKDHTMYIKKYIQVNDLLRKYDNY